MDKKLVIVESPAKAKTINKYLGNDFVVKSSIGHIRDLPVRVSTNYRSSNSKLNKTKKNNDSIKNEKIRLINRMGIDPWNDWKADYQILPEKENIVRELKILAAEAKCIYLATDLDREGEAIAWHLKEVIGGEDDRFNRVVFNEITKNAIRFAFEHPVKLNINRVNAQQARRFMDRIVGYMISPLLWKKIARGLSAGRVQSVAVRLIVERERKIKAFVPQELWNINAYLNTSQNENLLMRVVLKDCKILRLTNYQSTIEIIDILNKSFYEVFDKKEKSIKVKPLAPFITSTLQQTANIRLGFSVKKTMHIAQSLYENGYITYMRTDSTSLSTIALLTVRNYIKDNFGIKYLSLKDYVFSNSRKEYDAHEAIRPSDVNVLAEKLKHMSDDVKKLYYLIWCQFVASQMKSAEYDSVTLIVKASNFKLKAQGRILRFDGWTKLVPYLYFDNKDSTLPVLKIGDKLKLKTLIPSQSFSKPPARFSEASLVHELEKRGVGRPSTYASIISTIQDRGYVHIENRRFYTEKMGEIVINRLEKNFNELINYNFTANMEFNLDKVANNKMDWKNLLNSFFKDFTLKLDKAALDPQEGGMQINQMVLTSINCPSCSRKMGIRTAITGVFLGCSGYNILPLKDRCKKTINLIPENKIVYIKNNDEVKTQDFNAVHKCKECGISMDSYLNSYQYKLHICGNNPECNGYYIEKLEVNSNYNDEKQIIKCIKCGFSMYLRIGRFGRYIACLNDNCKYTRKILHNGKIAPPKIEPISLPELLCKKSNTYFVLRDGASGIFLAASTFPKSRETRSPLVEELKSFEDRLPQNLKYLTKAPIVDPEGNKTIVKFNRKIKKQYIGSQKEGKLTGWSMIYINNNWKEVKK